jgi:Protein of unknown function (DUF1553)/Protein of unknown function (DUF1549)/Planctomycete cytochrome C
MNRHITSRFFGFFLGIIPCVTFGENTQIRYERDIRPILAENCFACHGPDDAAREANLRLDMAIGQDQSDSHPSEEPAGIAQVVNINDPAASELLRRIQHSDPDIRMPPPATGRQLDAAHVELLRAWIAQGARVETHWAYQPVIRPPLPVIKNKAWARNEIDYFVMAKLEEKGMEPSPEAAGSTLLRRLSMDLTGLPPPVADSQKLSQPFADELYSQELERLLASPHFGERWARWWLDAARYADSDGFEKDKPRRVWMYRDWVIHALNQDLPYDQFIIRQIAGDLLPNATQDDRVATGFLRNSMLNEEGGIDPEQFRMEAMFDRIDAVGKAVLGLTVQCAQCHSHKYDPISHAEYYQLFAFLNNCHEGQITVYTDEQLAQWDQTRRIIDALEEELKAQDPAWKERMSAWEASLSGNPTHWNALELEPVGETSGGQKHYLLDDRSILAQGYAPTQPVVEFSYDKYMSDVAAVKIELLCDPNLPHGGPGRSIYGTGALTEFTVLAAPQSEPEKLEEHPFSAATADVNPPECELDPIFDDQSGRRRVTGPIAYAWDRQDTTAWTWNIGPGRSNVPHEAVFRLQKPIRSRGGVRLLFKIAQQHGGWNSDDNQTNNLGRFRISVSDSADAEADAIPKRIRNILALPKAERTPAMDREVFSYWRTLHPPWRDTNRRLEALWQSHPQGDTQLVLIERDKPRVTQRLERGNFLKPVEAVEPDVPAFLHGLPADAPRNRLTFARWLVDQRSPTTARSLVNRIWQAYFGTGLVATAEDLGNQASYPTHQELLDYLASELMERGWSQKHIHRMIVHSATYRQSSQVDPRQIQHDPDNRWLARGARFRVDAETVRDIGLSVSGLLTPRIGGPSVFPPAPAFLFQPPASYGPKTWVEDRGPDRYRRGMYTFRFRSVPHPALTNFDAPNGDVACVRRVRSNSPLQALTSLNEELSIECARALGTRILSEGGDDDSSRLGFAFYCVLGRAPQDREREVIQSFLTAQREMFTLHPGDAEQLVFSSPVDHADKFALSVAEKAAWTEIGRVLLNLDETITRE